MFIKIYVYIFTSLRKTYIQSETSALLHNLHIDWNLCCGSGSGIRYFFDLWIGDGKKSGSGIRYKHPGSATLIETQDNNNIKNWHMKARYVQFKICSRKQEYEEKKQKCLTSQNCCCQHSKFVYDVAYASYWKKSCVQYFVWCHVGCQHVVSGVESTICPVLLSTLLCSMYSTHIPAVINDVDVGMSNPGLGSPGVPIPSLV